MSTYDCGCTRPRCGALVLASPAGGFPVTSGRLTWTGICLTGCLIASTSILAPIPAHSQERTSAATFQGIVQGYVRDSGGNPVANATLVLKLSTGKETQTSPTRATQTQT